MSPDEAAMNGRVRELLECFPDRHHEAKFPTPGDVGPGMHSDNIIPFRRYADRGSSDTKPFLYGSGRRHVSCAISTNWNH